jgi:hypothetical protein
VSHTPLALVALLSIACNAAPTETRQLATAVESFRRAENPEKASQVDAIKRSPCTDADVCAARAVCVESAEATARGLALTASAEKDLLAIMKASQAEYIDRMLDEAKKANELGMKKLLECEDMLVALKRKHGA